MSQFYKILKADPLGDAWTPNQPGAKPIQNYWCQVEGEELAVSIGKQVGNTLTPGQHVYGDLMKATSQKGTDYWKFKGALVPDGVQRPADSPAQAQAQQAVAPSMSSAMPDWFMPISNQIDYIFREMRKMDSGISEPEPAKPAEPVVEPVDEITQASIDAMFPPKEEPTETPEEV